MARRLTYVTLFVLAGFLGRATIVDDRALSLVWPAAGVAVLWLMSARGRDRQLDALALAGATFVVNTVTGSSPAMGLVFIAANLAQVFAAVTVIERGFPAWPRIVYGGPLDSPRRLMTLLVASASGAVVGAMVGVTGLFLVTGFFSVDSTLTWWGRNAVGILGVASVGLLFLHRHGQDGEGHGARRRTRAWFVELTSLIVLTALLVWVDLGTSHLPVAFLLPALTVWAGMRFGSLVVSTHAVLSGSAAVLLTLRGEGPFSGVDSVQRGALLAQLFVGMTVVVGLFLAAAREESNLLQLGLKQSEQRAFEQAQVLATIIKSMQDGVLVLTERGRVALVNPAAARYLSSEVSTLLESAGEDLLLHSPATSLRRIADDLADAVRPGERTDVRFTQDGPVLSLTASALPPSTSGARGVVVVLTDVTEERARREDLASFAGVVAHDLLNPITAIEGWTQMLAESVQAPEPKIGSGVALERIQGSTERMRELVTDLLADATADKAAITLGQVRLEQLANEVVFDRSAAEHVTVGELPTVEGDARLLRQLLDNVIGNALKYVRPGTVPEVRVTGEIGESGTAVIRIMDRGIGVADDQERDAVFSRFQRGSQATVSGTGLGLAICKRIVERHSGEIRLLARTDGPGTVVEIALPQQQPAVSDAAPAL